MSAFRLRPESHSDKSLRWMIQSPARLHFGLTEICHGQPTLFGGCGIALDAPITQLSLDINLRESGAPFRWHVECAEPWYERVKSALEKANLAIGGSTERLLELGNIPAPSGTLRIDNPPTAHAGLGSGTQLACCVATLVAATSRGLSIESSSVTANDIWDVTGEPSESSLLDRLAEATGRGSRSFVGLACHLFGGFIFDHGKPANPDGSRTFDRFSVPETWRVLLVRPVSSGTISGERESEYFRRCAVPNKNRHLMVDIIQRDLIPAILSEELQHFGEALYQYGRYGGELFRTIQGGVYRDAAVTELVETIRRLGCKATGQTSWGPTVYAIVANQNQADELEERLRTQFGAAISTLISRPTNQPAKVMVDSH